MKAEKFVLAAVTFAGAVGCVGATDLPPARPYAFLTVEAVPSSASPSGFGAIGYGLFFRERVRQLTDSRGVFEACNPPTVLSTSTFGNRDWIAPGTPLTMRLQGSAQPSVRSVDLPLTIPSSGAQLYTNGASGARPPVYPGTDTVTFTAPGTAGGFPSFTVKARVVDDFTAQPVADSGGVNGLIIQWTPSTVAGSAMQVLLRYQSDAQASGIDRELLCSSPDDGELRVARSLLDGWHLAGDDQRPLSREVQFTRFRTEQVAIGDATTLLFSTLTKTQAK